MRIKKSRRQPKAEIKWSVVVSADNHQMEGVTQNLSEKGAFVRCAKPLGLNTIFEMILEPSQIDRKIKVDAEVVWTNIYGPDDEVTPRGMGVLFTRISNKDRDFISRTVSDSLESEGGKNPGEDKD